MAYAPPKLNILGACSLVYGMLGSLGHPCRCGFTGTETVLASALVSPVFGPADNEGGYSNESSSMHSFRSDQR